MIIVGRALTVLEEDISIQDRTQPFGLMFDALDDLKPYEVYLATGSSPTYALWGGAHEYTRDKPPSRRGGPQWISP